MKTSLVRICALPLVGISTLAFAAGPLKLAPKKGDTHKFHVVATLVLNGTELKVTNDETDAITDVSADGIVTLSESEENMTIEVAGQTQSPPAEPARTQKYRSDNTFISPDPPTEESKATVRAENLQTVKLPDFELADGKTWDWDIASDAKIGAVKLKVSYKVLGSEKIGGSDCWKISLTSKELEGDAPGEVTGTMWLRKEDAVTARVQIKLKNFPLPGAPGPIDGTVNQEFVS